MGPKFAAEEEPETVAGAAPAAALPYASDAPVSAATRFVALYVILGASLVFILNGIDLHPWIMMWIGRDGLGGTLRTFSRSPGAVIHSLAALFACYPAALVLGVWAATGRLWRWPLLICALLSIVAAVAYMPLNSSESGPWIQEPLDWRLFIRSLRAGSPIYVASGLRTMLAAGLCIWVIMSIPPQALRSVLGAARGYRGPADTGISRVLQRIALASVLVSTLCMPVVMNLWRVLEVSGWERTAEALAAGSLPLWGTVLSMLSAPLGLLVAGLWLRGGRVWRWGIAAGTLCAALPAITLEYYLLRQLSAQVLEVGAQILAYVGSAALVLLPVSKQALNPGFEAG